MENETVRVNVRLPVDLNDWLDVQSKRTGLPKSSIIMLATENYRREKEVMERMADMGELVAKIEQLESAIKRNETI